MISTHVLDTASGVPASGVPVALDRRTDDGWATLDEGRTNDDGRVPGLGPLPAAGVYRLRFDTATHLGPAGFFPEVTVQFSVEDPGEHLHVPLLLSPFGFTTYRGS